MSEYTTGEIARLCGITVRTVQYYDTRDILIPDKLSEGGRRLYSENNLRTMKIICFLRELGLPISSISQILSEENSDEVIYLLLEQQEKALREEAEESTAKLHKLEQLKNGLKSLDTVSVESIGQIDIAGHICREDFTLHSIRHDSASHRRQAKQQQKGCQNMFFHTILCCLIGFLRCKDTTFINKKQLTRRKVCKHHV